MCGFVGFFKGKIYNQDFLKSLSSKIIHRGPDDEGFFLNNKDKIYFAHRRLSIQDLSKSGYQPMKSYSGRYVIVYNGEIYNHNKLREKLGDMNWKSSTDTETLLTAFEVFGFEETLHKIEGMFAFACWDNKLKKLILARDRFGEKPLYYGWIQDTFFFTSDLITIKHIENFEPEIDKEALYRYINLNYIPCPGTIYKNIYKLEPSKFLEISNEAKQPKIKKYWDVNNFFISKNNNNLNFENQSIYLEKILSEKISDQLISKVSIGTFLSGGIDSSLITAIAQKMSSKKLETFSIGFDNKYYDESQYAKDIASSLGTKHYSAKMDTNKIKEIISKLPDVFSEPFADSSQIPTFFLSEIAKKNVTVALSGDGGDELFGGYNRYFLINKLHILINHTPFYLRKLISTIFSAVRPESYNIFFDKIGKLIPPAVRLNNYGDKIHKISKVILYEDLSQLYQFLISNYNNKSIFLEDHHTMDFLNIDLLKYNKLNTFVDKMMAADTQFYLSDDILCKVDRSSMANSLEIRVPFLNHKVFEFAWSLPKNFKINNHQNKVILRNILKKYVPENLINRPKMGFGIPLADLLRNELRDWMFDLLNEKTIKEQGLIDYTKVNKLLKRHLSKKENLTNPLWNLLMFQSWYQNS